MDEYELFQLGIRDENIAVLKFVEFVDDKFGNKNKYFDSNSLRVLV